MLRTTSLRALLALPTALAFVAAAPSARAQAPDPTTQLTNILRVYAADEGATTTGQLSRTMINASADDLVNAVYQYLLNRTLTKQEVAGVVVAALKADGAGRVRADKDKVAARILEAAIVARGAQSDATQVDLLLAGLGSVNNTLATSKQLTVTGKEALIGKAIRATVGRDDTGASTGVTEKIAIRSDELAAAAPGTTPALKKDTFTAAVLKTLVYKPQVYDPALASTSAATEATKGQLIQLVDGKPKAVYGQPLFNPNGVPPSIYNLYGSPATIGGVSDYIDAVLNLYAVDKRATTLKLAVGVATNPAVAGAVFGGYVKNLKTTGGAAATDTAITTLVHSFIVDARLAPAIADIVQNGLARLSAPLSQGDVGLLLFNTTAVQKGKIASGAVRADPSQAAATIATILSPTTEPAKDVTPAGLAAFATAAATGNGDTGAAAAISNAVIAKVPLKPTIAADIAAIETIAINVIKAVAPANPDSAFAVAQGLFSVQRNGNTVTPFPTLDARTKLAQDLAKGASTNYTAAGAAVAGVVEKSIALGNQGADITMSAAAIKVAAKAALSIAQKVSFSRSQASGFNTQTFASGLALASVSTNAGSIAAGVALTDTAHAGDIVKAVITSNNVAVANQNVALNKAAFTIASAAAVAVDAEAIADIAQKVGSLLQPTAGATNANLPKITTIGTLATSLAKAINTKPLVSWSNRCDELGELAAVLVTASLNVTGGKTPAALAAIGTNIFKAASAKLLANARNSNNAADLSDIARDVAGAIAQTIAHAPLVGPGSLIEPEKTALLNDSGTGSLIKLLSTGAKTYANQVNEDPLKANSTAAFNLVRGTEVKILGAHTGNYGYVPGTEAIGTNGTATPLLFSSFEIGSVVDSETPVKNL